MKTIFLSFSITDSSVTDYFLELSNQLAVNHKVIVIADKIEPHNFTISPAIEIFKWPSDRPNNFSDFWFLFRKTVRYRPQIMISMFGSVNLFVLVGFMLNIRHRIVWSHTISTASPAKKSLMQRKAFVYKLANRLFANSNATKQDLVENFNVKPAKIDLVYNAVREYKTNNKTVNPDKIVYVGSLIPMKGVDTLFEAMPAVLAQFPNVKLTMVGGYIGGNSMKTYMEKAQSIGISDNVVFLGRQTKQSVLEQLSDAYFSVAPSLAEAFGFNVIESFSVKTPVIGSDSTGISEIITDNSDGLLFKTKNAADLSAKMIRLLEDAVLRNTFSGNCHAHFLREFEVGSAVDKVVGHLDGL
ncbi:MAG TPA: glycosyltransferase family 4 protein [Flavobacterium sp.]|nr:glycosyltransferase family 4 protein [Flavobacterium sp.]